jgi:hypothetical protein
MFRGKCYHCGCKAKLVRYAYTESCWWTTGTKIITACDDCIAAGKGVHV